MNVCIHTHEKNSIMQNSYSGPNFGFKSTIKLLHLDNNSLLDHHGSYHYHFDQSYTTNRLNYKGSFHLRWAATVLMQSSMWGPPRCILIGGGREDRKILSWMKVRQKISLSNYLKP